jgi:hypothetical protein
MNGKLIMNLKGRIDCLFIAVSKMYVCRTNGASCPSLGTRCGIGLQDFNNM